MNTLEQAARDYCEAKEADRVLRLGMRPDGDCDYFEAPDYADDFTLLAEGQPACRHQTVEGWAPHGLDGPMDALPEERWCPACRHNAEIVLQSRAIRARFGGLASAMMAAYRREGS